jgi:hypothetical protein
MGEQEREVERRGLWSKRDAAWGEVFTRKRKEEGRQRKREGAWVATRPG